MRPQPHRAWKSGVAGVLVLAWLVGVAGASAAQGTDPETARTIHEVIEAARHPDLERPAFPYYKDEMQALYGPRQDAPFWFRDGRPIPQAGAVIALLQDVANRGLDPADYDAARLAKTWSEVQAGRTLEPRALGMFDTALSLAYLRVISDLHIGRITPRTIGVGFDVEPKKYDLPALVETAVKEDRIAATVDAAEPQLAIYRRLERALQTYRGLAADTSLRPVTASGIVRPGDAFADAPALAQRLAAYGDLDAPSVAPGATYSNELVEAVKRFQGRHGLAADGALGKATLAALNVPPAERVRQIELALERLRWLPDLRGGPFLAVNLPAFRVWGFDSTGTTGRPSLEMPVVIGKAVNTRTPVFEEDMKYVVFRPYWNVPYSIVKKDLVPALRKSSNALATRDMELVRSYDDPAPVPVTAANIDLLARGRLLVRQKPGPGNSLGLAKFIFPNANNIYMHGTPSQSLFERSRRDFSHGCIRLEDPARMAEWVLRDQPEWTRERIEAAMQGAKPVRVNLQRPLPVIIFYTTASVDLDGRVHFYDDIYGHDAQLESELREAYSYQP